MTKKQPFGEFGTPRPKLAVYGRNLIFYFENNREELQSVINGEKKYKKYCLKLFMNGYFSLLDFI